MLTRNELRRDRCGYMVIPGNIQTVANAILRLAGELDLLGCVMKSSTAMPLPTARLPHWRFTARKARSGMISACWMVAGSCCWRDEQQISTLSYVVATTTERRDLPHNRPSRRGGAAARSGGMRILG